MPTNKPMGSLSCTAFPSEVLRRTESSSTWKLGALGNIEGFFLISPDSIQVVYQAHQQNVIRNDFELYSVPLIGSATDGIILNGAPGALRKISDFQISPDSSRVVYKARPTDG